MKHNVEAKFSRRLVIKVATIDFCRPRKMGQNCSKLDNGRVRVFVVYRKKKVFKSFLQTIGNKRSGK